jgi:hypothetical protein
MNPWIAVAISPTIALLIFAFNVHSRFVPDIDTQKRQLMRFGLWVAGILAVGSQVNGIYALAHSTRPVTPGFVMDVASSVGGFAFTLTCFAAIYLIKLLDRFLTLYLKGRDVDEGFWDLQKKHVAVTGQMQESIEQNCDAIELLASQPGISPEIASKIRALLITHNSMKRLSPQITSE